MWKSCDLAFSFLGERGAPPTVTLQFFFFLSQLSGIVLGTGSSPENWVKELCVRPEAVPLRSQFSASPWKLQFPSQSLSHTHSGGDGGNWHVELRHKLWSECMHYLRVKPTGMIIARLLYCQGTCVILMQAVILSLSFYIYCRCSSFILSMVATWPCGWLVQTDYISMGWIGFRVTLKIASCWCYSTNKIFLSGPHDTWKSQDPFQSLDVSEI